MLCPHLLVGLAAALLRFTQYLKMDCLNELESVLEAKTEEYIGRGWWGQEDIGGGKGEHAKVGQDPPGG